MASNSNITFGKANIFCLGLMCFFLVYPAIQRLVLGIDAAGRMFMLATIASLPFILSNLRHLLRDPIYCLLIILTTYMICNGISKNSPRNGWEWMYVIYPLILLTLSYCNTAVNYKRTILCMAASLTFGLLLMLTLDKTSSFVELNGRFGNTFNANDIGLNAAFAITSLFLCSNKSTNFKLFFAISFIICIGAIFMSECRTALGVILFDLVAFLFETSRTSSKSKIKIVVIAILLAICVVFVMNTTDLGQRVMTTTEQSEGTVNETGTKWDLLGDRGMQYVEAGPYILSNLATGIGLSNWVVLGTQNNVFHSEYLVQLCENGLVGFCLYLLFLILFFARVIKFTKATKQRESYYLVAFLISVVFVDFFFWTYDNFPMFCLYGIIMSKCFHYKQYKRYIIINKTDSVPDAK